MIAVVDYRKGNLKSVARGLLGAGGDVRVTDDTAVIARADAIVLPGVGAFADAASTMCELGQMEVIRERIDAGVPFLGICLGLHLLFVVGMVGAPAEVAGESSAGALGLAVLPGVVTKMPNADAEGRTFKIPHVGWNSVADFGGPVGDENAGFVCPLLEGVAPGEYFYFTHSYIAPETPATVAVTEHSVVFPSVVRFRDAAFGVQFHPEKSSDAGARVLRNFVEIAKGA